MPLQTPPRLEMRLMGEMQVAVNGTPLTGKLYGKVLALLAYLAMEPGRRHSRETLADLLWPTLPTDAARTNLRQALYYLRRAFDGADFLLANRHTVSFPVQSSHWLDVKAFLETTSDCFDCTADVALNPCAKCLDAMAKRMSLYRGEFLEGLTVVEAAPEFEEWCAAKRALLHREALALLERLRLGFERRGAPEQALQFARSYTELEPWDEEGHRQLMRLLAKNGQRGAALAQYESCRAMLARDLGLEPEAQTQVLLQHIRDGALELAPPTHQPAPATSTNERRPATIFHCRFDIRDQDDPDEIAELLHKPRQHCAELVRRQGRHIAQMHGATILAYFGYPIAFEDATRRAVRAALQLAKEVETLIPLCIGIHTGTIVTGHDPTLLDAAGVATNVALRLCNGAAAGEVLISDATKRLIGHFFLLQAVEQVPFEGPPQESPSYRVIGESGVTNRLDASPRLSPLIGRRAELAQLWKLWKATKQGRGHLVLVRGEAGIGKSRLIRALRDGVSKEPCIVRELHCFPEYTHTPLHPVITLLETVFRLSPDDAPTTRLNKIVTYLAEHYPTAPQEVVPVLAALLNAAPNDEPMLPPQQQKERTFSVLLNLLEGLAARQPLLLVVEDVHWIDPSTLELLERHAQHQMAAPILVVYSARTEFQPAGLDKKSILELAPLNDAEVAQLVASVGALLADDTVHRIVARADGVPLFAEEMALMANEPTSGETAIPATLHYLLLARLDTLKEARRIAQLAATLGREFDRETLEQIVESDPATLDAALQSLQNARLISASTTSATDFQFHHALIQEAAYLSQTKLDRQTAHRRIAEALSTHFPHRAAQRPEQIARHFTAANAPAEALLWWLKAGRRALLAGTNTEAVDHLRAGLALIEKQPASDERDAIELDLLLLFGRALRSCNSAETGKYSHEAEQHLIEGERLARLDHGQEALATLRNILRMIDGQEANTVSQRTSTALEILSG